MKRLLFLFILFLVSCSKKQIEPTKTTELQMVDVFQTWDHVIKIYNTKGFFEEGYNDVFIEILYRGKDPILVENVEWTPLMKMHSMSHSCPKSSLKYEGEYLKGFVVFQMPSNDSELWEFNLKYSYKDENFSENFEVEVKKSSQKRVQVFQENQNRYVLALKDIENPKIGLNNIETVLYKMENMTTFTPLEGYLLELDPRMPGMGNHASPNNQDLKSLGNGLYLGKLSLTMTGFWNINLQLYDNQNRLIKGETISDSNEKSSLFFEIEF